MPRPPVEVADVIRAAGTKFFDHSRGWLSWLHVKVLTAILRCRTPLLGAHVDACSRCGYQAISYNSCRNRHCPKCQAAAQQKWIDARAARILAIPHFHLVFTLPSELKFLARWHPVDIYGALFRCVSELLLELGRTHLQAILGLTLVLHTWTRDLRFHPHLHVLATAGGLSLDGSRFIHLRPSKKRKVFLFHVKVMGRLLRGKMLDALRELQAKRAFPELDQAAFDHLMAKLARHKSWIVYAKAPFRRSQHVLSYLGRYTHRVGIANSRLIDVGPEHITFRTKRQGTATLHPVVFLARFVQHVLPDGFHKIRHAGLYACAQAGGPLERARSLLPPAPAPKEAAQPEDVPRCPLCGGLILRIPLSALARSPPLEVACV